MEFSYLNTTTFFFLSFFRINLFCVPICIFDILNTTFSLFKVKYEKYIKDLFILHIYFLIFI
jgi:hypothetical protein